MIVLQGVEEPTEELTFTPDGRGLVVPLDGKLQLWRDTTVGGAPAEEFNYPDGYFSQFTPDGRSIVFHGVHILIHELETAQQTVLRFRDPFLSGGSAAVSPDGRYLIAAQAHGATRPRGRLTCRAVDNLEVDIWSVDVERTFRHPPLFLPGHDRFVTIEWWCGIGSDFGPTFVTRDLHTGKLLEIFQRENRDANRPCEHPVTSVDRRLVAARNAGRIAVYQSENFAASPALLKNSGRKYFTGVAFHPSGRYLAATSNDETVKLYDTQTWEVAKTFTWDIGRMRSIAFSPDGALAAAGSDKGKVVVWDVDL